ncbi:hypothetical protein RQP46_007350 [Phenoliferia psychrophenolica]
MWADSDTSTVQQPRAARIHVPFRAHDAPESMGDDAFLRNRSARSSRRNTLAAEGAPAPASDSDDLVDDAGSETGLRGADVGVLEVYNANITNPTDASFTLSLEGQVTKVGIFPARLLFAEPVDVRPSTLSNLITEEVFTWRLKSQEVKALGFGFLPVKHISFIKDLTLPGMANMTDVSISDFQVPGDDPLGGFSIAVVAHLTNPSPFALEVGTLAADLYYEGLYLGPAQTANPINLVAGINKIPLVGRLLPYAGDSAAMDKLSLVFSNYLNGLSTNVQAIGRSITPVNGPQNPEGIIRPLTGVTIEALSLSLTPEAPYVPMVNSTQLAATFGLPFGFALRQSAGGTSGNLSLALPMSPLLIGSSYEDHLVFDQFAYDLANSNGSIFTIRGSTSAVADTALGQVKLTNITFVVPSGLIGLDGLSKYPTTVLSVDVIGGNVDAAILAIGVGLTNPANLELAVGNVTFQLYNGDSYLGLAVIPDLHLRQGYQEVSTIGYFEASNNEIARQTLSNYTQGTDTVLTISGFNGSSEVESLNQAFMGISLSAKLGGLAEGLVNGANLTVLDSTGITSDVANATVTLTNPFSADLLITSVQANVTHSSGIYVGNIVTALNWAAKGRAVDVSPTLGFHLNLYPPDLFTLVRLLAIEAGQRTDQLDGLVALGGLSYVETKEAPAFTPSPPASTPPAKRDKIDDMIPLALEYESFVEESLSKRAEIVNIYTDFNIETYAQACFAVLRVNVDMLARLSIDDFTTDFAYTQSNVPAFTDSTLFVQKVVDEAFLGVNTAIISNPTDTSFMAHLVGTLRGTGPFNAEVSFTQGLTVGWNGSPLGQIAMPNVTLHADVGADLDLEAAFTVADLAHVTDFASYLLTEPSFVWQIYGTELSVTALGITINHVSISKTSSITNPSQIGVALDAINFDAGWGSTFLGPVGSTGPFTLLPKGVTKLALAGRLVQQTTPQGLADVSTVINGFIHELPSELLVTGSSVMPAATWLNTGIKELKVAVILPAMKLDIINKISINQMTLMFTEDTAYSPSFSTNNTVALFQLPFAFPASITHAAVNIVAQNAASPGRMNKRDTGDFATVSVPMAPSFTDVVARTLLLKFEDIPFQSTDDGIFSTFVVDTTTGISKSFAVHGAADAIVNTAIGDLNLFGIAFSVETALGALQGLNAKPATVSDVDVFSGSSSRIQINANAHLFNPSPEITIGAGDVTFGVSFMGEQIGTALITGLVLVPGENAIPAAVYYQPSAGAQQKAGQVLLQNFVQAPPSLTTPIASLQAALATVKVPATIPPVKANLVQTATITVPKDVGQTGVAFATVSIANPFSSDIFIEGVTASASYNGNALGGLSIPTLNPPIAALGMATSTSQSLPLTLNSDLAPLVRFVEEAAVAQGVDLGDLRMVPVLAYLFTISDYTSSLIASVNPNPETCVPSGSTKKVQALVMASLANLRTNFTLQTEVKVGEYATPLDFDQNEVSTVFDETALYLLGYLGKPLVSHIADQAVLTVSKAVITNVTDGGLTVALSGALTEASPFDAQFEFLAPVDIYWEGGLIANVALPSLCSTGNLGIPDLEASGYLTIVDQEKWTAFILYALLNVEFTWTISTDKVRVIALGEIFDNVFLEKNITLQAFNKFEPGGITASNANFPGDAPDGIMLELLGKIPSAANLGIALGDVVFKASFDGHEVGPVYATDLTLAPNAVTNTTLTGVVTYRDDEPGLAALGTVFSQFLQGKPTTLHVEGVSVTSPAQPDSPVSWLTKAFSQFAVDVVLPGQTYEVISSVTLEDLTVEINTPEESYAAMVTNNVTNAVYRNPFQFSLQALEAGGAFTIAYNNLDSALLTLPLAPVVSAGVSTGQDVSHCRPLVLASLDNGGYANFISAIANEPGVSFLLHGGADVVARTSAGDVKITGVPFSVTSTFPGLDGFGGKASVPAVPVVIGSGAGDPFNPSAGGEFIRIQLSVILSNPAPIILFSNQVSFQVAYQGAYIGRAFINPLDLMLGSNTFATELQYAPKDPTDPIAQGVLSAYLQTSGLIPVAVTGDTESSPYGSLQTGFSHIALEAAFPGQGIPLVHDAVVYIDLVTAICTNQVSINFRVNNNLGTAIGVLGASGSGGQDGTTYATLSYSLKDGPFTTPAHTAPGDYGAEHIPATLTKGLAGSTPLLLPENMKKGLDLDLVVHALVDQYDAPAIAYKQNGVPYSIVVTANGVALDPATLGNNPFDTLGGLVGALAGATQCIPGASGLSIVAGASSILSQLGNLPGVLTSLLQFPPAVESALQGGGSAAASLVGDVTSLLHLSLPVTAAPPTGPTGSAQSAGPPPVAATPTAASGDTTAAAPTTAGLLGGIRSVSWGA